MQHQQTDAAIGNTSAQYQYRLALATLNYKNGAVPGHEPLAGAESGAQLVVPIAVAPGGVTPMLMGPKPTVVPISFSWLRESS